MAHIWRHPLGSQWIGCMMSTIPEQCRLFALPLARRREAADVEARITRNYFRTDRSGRARSLFDKSRISEFDSDA